MLALLYESTGGGDLFSNHSIGSDTDSDFRGVSSESEEYSDDDREKIFCLKEIVLDIQPNVVEHGGTTKLSCSYNLQGEPLYTVKYYRGTHEFYRYTPKEHPSIKKFPFNGVNIDLQHSNEHQVVLRDVGFNLSGKFSCEVTTDAPNFSTVTVSKDMLVVVLPTNSPSLSTDKSFYDIGDVLRASCTSPSSRPASKLTFILNNIEVCQTCFRNKTTVGELFESRMFMTLPLFESHFNNSRLTLKCVAKIGDFYHQETEIIFDNAKDPVPEKVTAQNEGVTKIYQKVIFLIPTIICISLIL